MELPGGTDAKLIDLLLKEAGLVSDGVPTRLSGYGELNRHWLVRTRTSERMVVRVFDWPFDEEEPVDRLAKEFWLLDLLAAAGAPVPRPFKQVRVGAGAALLMSWVPGRALGEIGTVGGDDAWHAAGRALRAIHTTRRQPLRTPGVVVAGGVQPYPDGWGGHILSQVRTQAGRLAEHRPELAASLARAVALVTDLVPWLDARPVTLLHADAHPWNVLVDGSDATWLDWEFAAVGDPHYDVMRLFLGRTKPIGAPPPAFLEGYGETTPEAARRVYELAYYIWMANDARYFPHRATYDDAAAYLTDLGGRIDEFAASVTLAR